ncbi:hypothetical protein GC207_04050 [bacterium]|nr:hypothetical protein [bacterium]
MNSPAQELLNDLMNDRPTAFDEQLLAGTLAAVRRRRFHRKAGRVSMVTALVLIAATFWFTWPRPTAPSIANVTLPAKPNYIVHTVPLAADEIVTTRATEFAVIDSSHDDSLIVKTVPSPDLYQKLTDQELMVLLAGHDAVIVRQPGKPAMLILDGKPLGDRLDVN